MLLFKTAHVEKILDGTKTQTRRAWKRCRVRVGSVHQCYTRPAWARPPGEAFASIRIIAVRTEPLYEISAADAGREGYASVTEYLDAFRTINRLSLDELRSLPPVYVVDFELANRSTAPA